MQFLPLERKNVGDKNFNVILVAGLTLASRDSYVSIPSQYDNSGSMVNGIRARYSGCFLGNWLGLKAVSSTRIITGEKVLMRIRYRLSGVTDVTST